MSSSPPPAKRRTLERRENAPAAVSTDCWLAQLPEETLRRILAYLSLSSRSCLRQTCIGFYRRVEVFERDLINGRGDGTNRTLLQGSVERLRWLIPPQERIQDAYSEDQIYLPYPQSELARVTEGDFLDKPSSCGDYEHSGARRNRDDRYYDSGEVVDGNLLVLYYEYYNGFEVYDLDTGDRVSFDVVGGPTQNYVNNEEERIRLLLNEYSGRFGFLGATLGLSCGPSNHPHGAWSGPYLTVWDLLDRNKQHDDNSDTSVRLKLDLKRPKHEARHVSIVAEDKCAVLLVSEYDTTSDDAVLLQWLRIPPRGPGLRPPPPPKVRPPGPPPPEHHCGMDCSIFRCPARHRWHFWKRQKEDWERQEASGSCIKEASSDDCEYSWWPADDVLLKENVLVTELDPLYRQSLDQAMIDAGEFITAMHCDGGGFLVILVGQFLFFYHVGTMALVRVCDPSDLYDFHHHPVSVTNFVTSTQLYELQDIPGDGYTAQLAEIQETGDSERWALFTEDHTGEKDIRYRNAVRTPCGHKFDLSCFDTDLVLARFAHATVGEQRDFEQGICGIRDGALIRRSKTFPAGSCSPQLDCIVRVAFSIYNEHAAISKLVLMDVNPLYHIRTRTDAPDNSECLGDHDPKYAESCMGQRNLFVGMATPYCRDKSSNEQTCVIDWERGGVFDFSHRDNPMCDERERLENEFWEFQRAQHSHRFPIHIAVDSCKLIVCTQYEVSIWPLPVSVPGCSFDTHGHHVPESQDDVPFDKFIRPWYAVRPCDEFLCKSWPSLRARARGRYGEIDNEEEETEVGIADIIQEMAGFTIEEENRLYGAAEYSSSHFKMSIAGTSWRYLILATGDTSGDDESGFERLHLFDALGKWAREPRPAFGAEAQDENSPASVGIADVSGVSFPAGEDSEDEYYDESSYATS